MDWKGNFFLNGNKLEIEDEYHAFFICPRYVNIRERYLYNWYFSRTDCFCFYSFNEKL